MSTAIKVRQRMQTEKRIEGIQSKCKILKCGCIQWMGKIRRDGYGVMTIRHKKKAIHRLAYELFVGDIPEDMCVCHKCNNKLCIHPEHLYLADHGTNIRDAARDGLMSSPKFTIKEEDIEIIRKRHSNGEGYRTIAEDYDYSKSAIRNCTLKRTKRYK